MKLYLIPLPENKLEAKGRIAGWRHVPLDRQKKRDLAILSHQLCGKNISHVFCSDLDEEAGRIVAHELSCQCQPDFSLRRFNFGRQHSSRVDHLDSVLERVFLHWKDNKAVPIRGGDSLLSLEKRLFRAVDKLLEKDGEGVLVTDIRTANLLQCKKPEALLANGEGVQRGKVYIVHRENKIERSAAQLQPSAT